MTLLFGVFYCACMQLVSYVKFQLYKTQKQKRQYGYIKEHTLSRKS